MEIYKLTKYVVVDGINVYIHWNPNQNIKIKHKILRGKGGGIDVICYHEKLDVKLIKNQIILNPNQNIKRKRWWDRCHMLPRETRCKAYKESD